MKISTLCAVIAIALAAWSIISFVMLVIAQTVFWCNSTFLSIALTAIVATAERCLDSLGK
jgi:hypothetical protein